MISKNIKRLIITAVGLGIFTGVMAGTVGSCEPEDDWACTQCWFTEPVCDMMTEVQDIIMECQAQMGATCADLGGTICSDMDLNWTTCSATCLRCACVGTATNDGAGQPVPEWD
jgi:hypothetical protein